MGRQYYHYWRNRLCEFVPFVYQNRTHYDKLFHMFEMVVEKVKASEAPRVDKRVESTRTAILDVAVQLYQQNGIDKTSISQVIESAKVGRTTFYRHFADRDELLNQVLNRDFSSLITEFESATRRYDTLEEQIEQDMLWFLDQFASRPALSLLFSGVDWQRYEKAAKSVSRFRDVSIACATPTYQRASTEGRLRTGITMDNYIDWASFVVMSLQTVKVPSKKLACDHARW